jgi:excinuclease UvrABC nuclease subunit
MAYVYRFVNSNNSIIYVGYTGQTLDKRMGQHFHRGHLPKKCYNSIAKIEYIKCKTKSDAMIIETYMINKYKPIYNKLNKQSDAITLNIEYEENWKVYRQYKTTNTNYKYKGSSFSTLIVRIGVIALILYAFLFLLISII